MNGITRNFGMARSWNFNVFMTNHIRIDCCVWDCAVGRDDDLYIMDLCLLSLSVRRFFRLLLSKTKTKKPHIIASSHEHTRIASTIAIVPSIATIYCLYWIQKRCISIKIHCVNRGLNMMDLLHIKTKQNKMRNNNSDSNQQWKQSTTEPFLLIDVQNQES